MDDRGFGRHDRVAALLRRELAQLIQQSVKDPRLGSVTVTDVEVTRDLSLPGCMWPARTPAPWKTL